MNITTLRELSQSEREQEDQKTSWLEVEKNG